MAEPTSSQQSNKSSVEVIDLTNETTKLNNTITIDDSFAIDSDLFKSSSSDEEFVKLPKTPERKKKELTKSPERRKKELTKSPESPKQALNKSPAKKICRDPIKTSKTLEKQLRQQQKQLEKQQKDQQKAQEKLQREANRANAACKALDNCVTIIDNNILKLINDEEGIALRTLADESMVSCKMTEFPKVENCISWTHKRAEIVDDTCVTNLNESEWMILVINGSDYLKRLLTYRDEPTELASIKRFLLEIKRRSGRNLILMVYNLANYLKAERAKDAKNYRKNFKDRFEGRTDTALDLQTNEGSGTLAIGTTELQELRLTLEMELKQEEPKWKLHFEFYEKTNDIVQAIIRYSISVAKSEVKKKAQQATGLDWAINMDKDRAVDPTKSPEDLTKLWITQLQQFSQITLPIAKAIAAEYPSPCALIDQYKNLTSDEAESLLAELYVQRNLKRQIGSNISKKIHCFMTCRDPKTHIGLQ